MLPDDPRHGTYAGAVNHWFDGERPCEDCARAEWRYRKRRKLDVLRGQPRRLPCLGTVRRYQALQALGWTGHQIAAAAGVSVATLRSLQYHHSATVRTATAEAVAETYERLSMQRPEGRYANRARLMAARKGWAPPLAWDDIDDPDEQPRGVRTTERRDLLTEWAELEAAGESIEQAAARLGVTVSAIERAEYRRRRAAA